MVLGHSQADEQNKSNITNLYLQNENNGKHEEENHNNDDVFRAAAASSDGSTDIHHGRGRGELILS